MNVRTLCYKLVLNVTVGITRLPLYRTADRILSLFFKMVNNVEVVIHTILLFLCLMNHWIHRDLLLEALYSSLSTSVSLPWLGLNTFNLNSVKQSLKEINFHSLARWHSTQWNKQMLPNSSGVASTFCCDIKLSFWVQWLASVDHVNTCIIGRDLCFFLVWHDNTAICNYP